MASARAVTKPNLMKVAIVETALRDQLVGHEAWVKPIAKRLIEHWHDDVDIWCDQRLTQTVKDYLDIDVNFYPRFSHMPYKTWREPLMTPSIAKQIEQGTQEIVTAMNEGPRYDAAIFPTAWPYQVAIAPHLTNRPRHMTFLFHFAVDQIVDKPAMFSPKLRSMLHNPGESGIRCVTTTESLAAAMREYGFPVESIPMPCYTMDSPTLKTSPIRKIGFFGHQRESKDGGFLLPTISTLLEAGYEVLLQNSSPTTPLNHDNLEKIERYVDPEELSRLIATCDVVVSTNKAEEHIMPLSGIILESLAKAVPVVVPDGTHMARLVYRFSAGATYAERTPISILTSIKHLETYYDAAAGCAMVAARWLSKNHGFNNYADGLRNFPAKF